MPKLVSTDDLKDALAGFKERGDGWWAKRSEVPTTDDVQRMIGDAVDGISGLTDEDVEEVLGEAEDPP